MAWPRRGRTRRARRWGSSWPCSASRCAPTRSSPASCSWRSATEATAYIYREAFGSLTARITPMGPAPVPGLAELPVFGPVLFAQDPATYLSLAILAGVWFLLFRTTWGLAIRAVGEHPAAADTAGIDVTDTARRVVGGALTGPLVRCDRGPARIFAEGDHRRAGLDRRGARDLRPLAPGPGTRRRPALRLRHGAAVPAPGAELPGCPTRSCSCCPIS